MECPACGRPNRTTATFCAWCGQTITAQMPAEEPPWLPGARSKEAAAQVDAQGQEPVSETPTGPLQVGQVLLARYEVLEMLPEEDGANRYRVRDLGACAHCGAEQAQTASGFCAACGAALDDRRLAVLIEQVRHAPEDYAAHFTLGERDYYVLVEPGAPPPATPAPAAALRFGLATHPGRVRDHNEDASDARSYQRSGGLPLGLFTVADGLGGQDMGEVASRLAVDAAWQSLWASAWQPAMQGQALEADALAPAVQEAVRAANAAVLAERQARTSEMSTTLTLALVWGGEAFIASVGDSRAYRWGGKGLERVTHDHSLVQRLVDAGAITPQEVYVHPQRNIITHSIGEHAEIEMDSYRCTLGPDERLLLCSDGLWEMVREEGLEEVLLSEPDPQRACDRLVEHANMAGGEDNITVIIVQVS